MSIVRIGAKSLTVRPAAPDEGHWADDPSGRSPTLLEAPPWTPPYHRILSYDSIDIYEFTSYRSVPLVHLRPTATGFGRVTPGRFEACAADRRF